MTTEALLITLAILALGLVWLALPFAQRQARLSGAELARYKEREVLLTDYERILATLRDIDEDYRLGKLPPDAYTVERERWAVQGAAVLAALEQLGGQSAQQHAKAKGKANQTQQPGADAALDQAIEQAIANYAKAKEGAGD